MHCCQDVSIRVKQHFRYRSIRVLVFWVYTFLVLVKHCRNIATLTLMLLVINLTNKKDAKNEKWLKPWHMGTHLRVLSKSYPMNTYITGFRKSLHPCALDKSSFRIRRANIMRNLCPNSSYKHTFFYKNYRPNIFLHELCMYELLTCVWCLPRTQGMNRLNSISPACAFGHH